MPTVITILDVGGSANVAEKREIEWDALGIVLNQLTNDRFTPEIKVEGV
jgi:hypothetical protein